MSKQHPGDGEMRAADDPAEDELKVEDRRHWTRDEGEAEDEGGDDAGSAEAGPRPPSILDEFRDRAEQAEAKLHEYIEAYKSSQHEQDAFRDRLRRDVERRVELQFGELVAELLGSLDDLDRALEHASGTPESAPLAEGVGLARSRFLDTLERHGVSRVDPVGEPFDPNEAEALQMEPVDTPDANNTVIRTLQPGYRLGERVLRAARVVVGRHAG